MDNFKGYKDCQKKYMDETMKEFEKNKLKVSGKRIVKDRKQAVAIGLNTAQRKCKYTKNDLIKRIIESGKDGIKITKNIFEELDKIL